MYPTNKPIQYTSSWYPTLSTKGWVTGLHEKIDLIFSHYVTSQYHQTTHHLGNVRSLQYTVKQFYSQPERLKEAITEDLIELIGDYVDELDVRVSYTQRDEGPQYDYEISLSIIHQGYQWKRFKTYRIDESKFEELMNINNTGGVSLV